MKVLGIIAEYNPFHNGHLYHLNQSKSLCHADYTICVMSGNFIQRGEPAIINKWARTEMALSSGMDLVLEIPCVYAMASAEFFAYGSVKILDSLGVIDYLCFGSEQGSLDELDLIAQTLHNEPEAFKSMLKHELNKGMSFPSARESALDSYWDYLGVYENKLDVKKIIRSSNNILAVEYLKAIKKLRSTIKPIKIDRVINTYDAEQLTGSISSATSIRRHILGLAGSSCENELENVLPASTHSIVKREFEHGRGPVYSQSFGKILIAAVRRMTAGQLKALPYVSEGLENRIKDAANTSGTLDEFIDKISTRRYPNTRIQRSLFSILSGMTGEELDTFNRHGGPQYARVLGFNKRGQHLLAKMNKTSSLPIITKAANFKNSCNPLLRRMLEIESASTDMYVLGYSSPEFMKAGQEYTQNVIRVDG